MARTPYLVRVTRTDNPRSLMITINKDRHLIDFYNFKFPDHCFTGTESERFSTRGIELLNLIDPGLMPSTKVYRPGTVRMSLHRAKGVPELEEYAAWLNKYLLGY